MSELDNCLFTLKKVLKLHQTKWDSLIFHHIKERSLSPKSDLLKSTDILEILIERGVKYDAVPREQKTEFLRGFLLDICSKESTFTSEEWVLPLRELSRLGFNAEPKELVHRVEPIKEELPFEIFEIFTRDRKFSS
jgi:hypothetical protein